MKTQKTFHNFNISDVNFSWIFTYILFVTYYMNSFIVNRYMIIFKTSIVLMFRIGCYRFFRPPWSLYFNWYQLFQSLIKLIFAHWEALFFFENFEILNIFFLVSEKFWTNCPLLFFHKFCRIPMLKNLWHPSLESLK